MFKSIEKAFFHSFLTIWAVFLDLTCRLSSKTALFISKNGTDHLFIRSIPNSFLASIISIGQLKHFLILLLPPSENNNIGNEVICPFPDIIRMQPVISRPSYKNSYPIQSSHSRTPVSLPARTIRKIAKVKSHSKCDKLTT